MLFGGRDPFYPFERAILEAVAETAPSSIASVLRAQIAQIRHVQRTSASPEINFYASRAGGGWSNAWLLPTRSDVRLARVTVRIGDRTYAGEVHAVNGHLFSLVLRPEIPKPRRAVATDIESHFERSSLMGDPQRNVALELAPPSFATYEAEEPGTSWAVLSRDDIYVVSLPDAEWVVLGAGPQGLLLLGRHTDSGESFCVANVEDDTVRPLTAPSIASALREVETGAS